MDKLKIALVIALLAVLYCCNRNQNAPVYHSKIDSITANTADSVLFVSKEEADSEEEDRLFWEQDSLKKLQELDKIIKFVEANKQNNYLSDNYERQDSAGYLDIIVSYRYGHIFTKQHKHLFIETSTQPQSVFRVYLLKNNKLTQVVYQTMGMEHIGDTIIDRNDDGIKDLDMQWYALAGCCLRNAHEVFLCKPDGTFSQQYSFINPTFNTKTHIIRGVGYGHPQNTYLYKYKWNGFNQVDTLEHIYPNRSDSINTTYYKTKGFAYFDYEDPQDSTALNAVKLKKLPEDYFQPQNLDSEYLGWFGWY